MSPFKYTYIRQFKEITLIRHIDYKNVSDTSAIYIYQQHQPHHLLYAYINRINCTINYQTHQKSDLTTI